MEKVKLLVFYSTKGFAGLGRNISLLVGGLDLESFEVTVVLLAEESDRMADFRESSSKVIDSRISFIRLPEQGRIDLAAIREIARIAEEKNINIVSCHGYKATFLAVSAKLFCGMKLPIVKLAHGWVTPGLMLSAYYVLDKLLIHFCEKVILVAEGQRKQLRGFGIADSKTVLIHNGIDVKSFDETRTEANTLPEIELPASWKQKTVVGLVSRLSAEKSVETSITGFSIAFHSNKDLRLVIAGAGAERSTLESQVDTLELKDYVIFLGHVSAVERLYSHLDIFVSSSTKEGLPNSLLEAQAASVPCIVTRISGHTDVIVDGRNGFLFSCGDSERLAELLLKIADDSEMASKLSFAARAKIVEHFSLEKRVEAVEQVYRDALGAYE